MGSPEGYETADKSLTQASSRGGWVLLKNVHLAAEWLNQVERRLNRMQCHASFKLFMTMEMSASLPPSLLASAKLVVYEPPTGLKASVQRSLGAILPAQGRAERGKGPVERGRLLLLLSWLHGVVLGRLRYCPIGWTKAYEFSETDLQNAAEAIDVWLERACEGRSNIAPDKIPWNALHELIALSYGGRIENDFDQAALRSLMRRFFSPRVFDLDYTLVVPEGGSADGEALVRLPEGSSEQVIWEWIGTLPDVHGPSWIGLPSDADTILMSRQGRGVMDGWALLLSSSLADDEDRGTDAGTESDDAAAGAAGGGAAPKWSRQLASSVKKWLDMIPEGVDAPPYKGDDPVMRCVSRELEAAARIVATIRGDLGQVVASLSHGTSAVSSPHIRDTVSHLRRGQLPDNWRSHHVVPASLQAEPWIKDLVMRVSHVRELWSSMAAASEGEGPIRVWLGGLFQPGAFLTATRQRTARALSLSLENLTLAIVVGDDEGRRGGAAGSPAAASGCQVLVERCMLHAARWDSEKGCLAAGGSEAAALPPLALSWCQHNAASQGELDVDQGAAMVSLPMYLNSERSIVLCSVELQGQAQEVHQAGLVGTPWHELGAAISLWSEP